MTMPEACQLILQAAALAPHAAIYTLDMGEPVRIRDLAEQMIRLSERGGREQISIVYTGLRPGEKLHEVLFHPDEKYQRTVHPRIFQAEQRPVSVQQVAAWLEEARAMVEQHDEAGLAQLIHRVVPEYEAIDSERDSDAKAAGIDWLGEGDRIATNFLFG